MPTLSINKSLETRKETQVRQLHLSLPRMRVSVQPAAAARFPGPALRHGAWLPRRKSLADSQRPADRPPASLVLRPSHDGRVDQPEPPMSPVAFARDVLGVRLWEKQEEVLMALTTHRRIAVKAGNGLGKGFCAAVAILWFMHTHQDSAVVLTTAPTFRQVRHILWRQLRRLYRPAAKSLGGTMLDTRWEFSDNRYAIGLSADGADQFQGFHSPSMFIVVDEAEGVDDDIYEAIEAVMTSAEPLLLLIGNPTSISGTFRRAFHEDRELYHAITISALESPNVRTGRVVIPGLTTAQWVEERKIVWKEDGPLYLPRVLGEFPHQSEDTLISLTDIEAAVSNIVDAEYWSIGPETILPSDRPSGEDVILAVDVARYGSDRSVILRRCGDRVEDIRVLRQMDTMQVTGWVVAAIREHNPAHVLVDEIGIGAGVVDRLHELGHPVRGINVAQKARDDRTFANLRAEGYWNLAARFRSGSISIPDDSELMAELTTLRFSYDSQGRVRIQSKEDMRSHGLPSPDKADALMLSFLDPHARVQIWT